MYFGVHFRATCVAAHFWGVLHATLIFGGQGLRGLHHPELRVQDDMKQIHVHLASKQPALARKVYVKMREECLLIDGRKIGDKVCEGGKDGGEGGGC